MNPHTSISSPKPIEYCSDVRLRMLGAASRLYNGRWSANLGEVAGSDRGVPHDQGRLVRKSRGSSIERQKESCGTWRI